MILKTSFEKYNLLYENIIKFIILFQWNAVALWAWGTLLKNFATNITIFGFFVSCLIFVYRNHEIALNLLYLQTLLWIIVPFAEII